MSIVGSLQQINAPSNNIQLTSSASLYRLQGNGTRLESRVFDHRSALLNSNSPGKCISQTFRNGKYLQEFCQRLVVGFWHIVKIFEAAQSSPYHTKVSSALFYCLN